MAAEIETLNLFLPQLKNKTFLTPSGCKWKEKVGSKVYKNVYFSSAGGRDGIKSVTREICYSQTSSGGVSSVVDGFRIQGSKPLKDHSHEKQLAGESTATCIFLKWLIRLWICSNRIYPQLTPSRMNEHCSRNQRVRRRSRVAGWSARCPAVRTVSPSSPVSDKFPIGLSITWLWPIAGLGKSDHSKVRT